MMSSCSSWPKTALMRWTKPVWSVCGGRLKSSSELACMQPSYPQKLPGKHVRQCRVRLLTTRCACKVYGIPLVPWHWCQTNRPGMGSCLSYCQCPALGWTDRAQAQGDPVNLRPSAHLRHPCNIDEISCTIQGRRHHAQRPLFLVACRLHSIHIQTLWTQVDLQAKFTGMKDHLILEDCSDCAMLLWAAPDLHEQHSRTRQRKSIWGQTQCACTDPQDIEAS